VDSYNADSYCGEVEMTRQGLLSKINEVNRLADNLARSDKVNSFDDGDRIECGTLAHCFRDLENSFCEFLDVHLPKLMAEDLKPEEIENILFDIGEEFRHVLYHIKDPKYFRHVLTEYES